MAKKILIVDDEEQLVDMLEVRLKSKGYDVIIAYDGEEGLRKARIFKPDLIVLDVVMPKMLGNEVVQNLNDDRNLVDIPIIFLTALAEGINEKRRGKNLIMAKPFKLEDLLLMISRVLGDD